VGVVSEFFHHFSQVVVQTSVFVNLVLPNLQLLSRRQISIYQ
jgi:hypothetical protein